jgi:hypothetical protein
MAARHIARRAGTYRHRAQELAEEAGRVRDEADRKHLLELAATYRRAAALRGFNVVVPVDGMSSEGLYFDQASAWLLANGTGGIGPKVTLTTFDMIKF